MALFQLGIVRPLACVDAVFVSIFLTLLGDSLPPPIVEVHSSVDGAVADGVLPSSPLCGPPLPPEPLPEPSHARIRRDPIREASAAGAAVLGRHRLPGARSTLAPTVTGRFSPSRCSRLSGSHLLV